MKRGKKSQFYLIAAGIIVFILVSLAVVSNYVAIKKEPQKFYDIGDVLQREGPNVVTYAVNKNLDVNANVQTYLELYRNYLETNVNTDFDLIIFYGDTNMDKITAQRFTRASLGELTINFGPTQTYITGGTEVQINNTEWQVNRNPDGDTVNVTLTSQRTGETITIKLPILRDNNFAFVMTSSDEFNSYIQSNIPTTS